MKDWDSMQAQSKILSSNDDILEDRYQKYSETKFQVSIWSVAGHINQPSFTSNFEMNPNLRMMA